MLFSFAFGTLQGIAQTSAGRHACIRVAVDAVGQVGRIPNLLGRRSRLLGSFRNHLAGEQALIEHSSKSQRAAVAHRPQRADEEAGATTDEPVGPAADASGPSPAGPLRRR